MVTNEEKLDLSVAIITNNEEDRLPKTLESIRDIASEIVVIDSGSTDRTIEIAKGYGVIVYQEDWKGYTAQKNSLIEKCNCEWILFLDADEVITAPLKNAIIDSLKQGEADGFSINRKTHYVGKLLSHAWQPNYRLRLVKRDKNPRWEGEIVHEELLVDGVVKELPSYMEHYSYRSIQDHFNKTIGYAKLSALSYKKRGKRPSFFKMLVNPLFSFIKLYIIKLGFLDGVRGLIAGFSAFVYTFLKYVFLWELYLKDKKEGQKNK